MQRNLAWMIIAAATIASIGYAYSALESPGAAVVLGLLTLGAGLAGLERGRLARSGGRDGRAPPEPAKPTAEPLRLLALLQREGRLLDFLMEDIAGYADVQVGAAIRDIHRECRKVLDEHLVLEPVLPQQEEEQVTVSAGFDPSAVRLTGNVSGQPPFTGTLKHHGWRVKELKLSPPPRGQDEFVLMPAEVELG